MKPQSRARKNLRFVLRVSWLLTKGLGLAFLVLTLLAAGGLYWLSRSVDAGKARGILLAQLHEVFQRPVQIQGVVLTPQGIKVHGVAIGEKSEPGLKMLESDIALITIKALPLLSRRLELKKVTLVSPRIRVARDKQGEWSFADIFSSTRAARPASVGRFSLPISLAAESIVIEGGVLTVEDRLRDTTVQIERFNLAVDDFALEAPFSFAASFDNTSRIRDREMQASLSASGSAHLASFRWPEAYVSADRLELKADGRSIKGSAVFTVHPRLAVEADLRLPDLGPADWERYFGKASEDFELPGGHWKGRVSFEGGGRLRFPHLTVEAGGLSVDAAGQMDILIPEPHFEGSFAFTQPFPLEAAARFRPSWGARELMGRLEGTAKLSGWPGRLAAHEAHMTGRGVGGKFKHWSLLGAAFKLDADDDFTKAELTVSSAAVVLLGAPFADVGTTLRLTGKEFKVESLSALWEGSPLRARARVVDISAPKEVSIVGRLDKLRWESAQRLVENAIVALSTRAAAGVKDDEGRPWVRTFKYVIPRRFPDTMGHIRIGRVEHPTFWFRDTDLLWDLRGVSPTLKKVDGEIRVGFGPGRIGDIQAVQGSHKFLTIVFLPYIYMHKMNNLSVLSAATAYPKTLDFSRIEGQYSIQAGDVLTRFSNVDSPQVKAYTEGSADFAKETVDMTILTRLTSYRAPLPEWWVDELGRPAIGFRVKGNLNEPNLEPRLRKLASDELEKALEQGRGAARERVRAVEKVLERLRGI